MKHLRENGIKFTVEITEEDLNHFFEIRPLCRRKIYGVTKFKDWKVLLNDMYYKELRDAAKGTRFERLFTSKEEITEGLLFGWKKMIMQKCIEEFVSSGFAMEDQDVLKLMSDYPFNKFVEEEINSFRDMVISEKREYLRALSALNVQSWIKIDSTRHLYNKGVFFYAINISFFIEKNKEILYLIYSF